MNLAKRDLGMQRKIDNITVVVYMITYNHEKYIKKAIDSVLMQVTNFKFKLIIGEDCSTDNTLKICKKYKDLYPDKIELIKSEKNIGAAANARMVYDACFKSGSKYIAMCEGDDYWTDPFKLQKQVDFLESNSEYVLCGHSINVVDSEGTFKRLFSKSGTYIRADLLKEHFISTLSAVFVNKLGDLPSFEGAYNGDTMLFNFILGDKKAYVLPEVMGVQREHCGGVWSLKSSSFQLQHILQTYQILKDRIEFNDNEEIIIDKKIKDFEIALVFSTQPLIGSLTGKIPMKYFISEYFNIILGKLYRSKVKSTTFFLLKF